MQHVDACFPGNGERVPAGPTRVRRSADLPGPVPLDATMVPYRLTVGHHDGAFASHSLGRYMLMPQQDDNTCLLISKRRHNSSFSFETWVTQCLTQADISKKQEDFLILMQKCSPFLLSPLPKCRHQISAYAWLQVRAGVSPDRTSEPPGLGGTHYLCDGYRRCLKPHQVIITADSGGDVRTSWQSDGLKIFS